MDSMDLVAIPRFMGHNTDAHDQHLTTMNTQTTHLLSKLIAESKTRKKLRLSSQLDQSSDANVLKSDGITNDDVSGEDIAEPNEGTHEDNSEEAEEDKQNEDMDEDEEMSEDMSEVVDTELDSNNFAIIGEVKKAKIIKLETITDKWITKPVIFERDIKNSKNLDEFSDVIDEQMMDLLSKNRINRLFPVQQQVIPYLVKCLNNSHIIRPKDVCVCSPTGSGKTLSFVIPIVQYLRKRVVTKVRVLVVLPVRDLAVQVFQVFHTYCQKTSLKVGLVVGHKSFDEECHSIVRKSVDGLNYHSLVDILVATPGKLVDLIQRADGFSLRHLEILVLDESDRMVSELQFNWLQEIESSVFGNNRKHHCFCSIDGTDNDCQLNRYNVSNECCCLNNRSVHSKPIHKILFSATLSTDPEKLKFISLFEPILFMVSSDPTSSTSGNTSNPTKHLVPEELKEFMIIAKEDRKPLIVWYLMEVLKYRKVLCFTGSVENSHRLYSLLKEMSGLVIAEFSSKLSAKKRQKLLNRFVCEKIDLIICSDIFARGLDIDGINYVICYDPPRNETQYIHRVGRTARAGNQGTAITLVTPTQLSHFNIISRRIHKRSDCKDKSELQIEKMVVKESQLKPQLSKYKSALNKLSLYIKVDAKKKQIMKRNFKH